MKRVLKMPVSKIEKGFWGPKKSFFGCMAKRRNLQISEGGLQ
jgi:hypothetical protein